MVNSSQDSNPIIVLGDLHVEENSIEECAGIILEVCNIARKLTLSGSNWAKKPRIIQIGDLCDKNKLNGKELFSLTSFVNLLKVNCYQVIIQEGNHGRTDKFDHIVNYLSFLGIQVFGDEYIEKDIMYGHWFVDKSNGAFGHYKYKVEDLSKYRYVILGHQHDPQQITERIFHLGSARYTSFGENASLRKRIAVITGDNIEFVELESVIPLYKVSSLEELDKLPKRAKVQYEFQSFKQLKDEIKTINEIKKTFFAFKKKNTFTLDTKTDKQSKVTRTNIREIIESWLKTVPDDETRNLLHQELKGEIQ